MKAFEDFTLKGISSTLKWLRWKNLRNTTYTRVFLLCFAYAVFVRNQSLLSVSVSADATAWLSQPSSISLCLMWSYLVWRVPNVGLEKVSPRSTHMCPVSHSLDSCSSTITRKVKRSKGQQYVLRT